MKKNIFLSILFFAAGFLTHAFFFPEVLQNGFSDVKQIVIPEPTTVGGTQNDPLITKVTFDGKKFSKHAVTIGFTRYIQIVNTNETELMSLIATTPELTTPRGYGHMEAVQMQFNKKGTFAVADRNNQNEKLIITVK